MKNYLILIVTILALYACSERSSDNVPPTKSPTPTANQRISSESTEEVFDVASIVSSRYDGELPEEDKMIYEQNPEIDAILWAEKGQGILGVTFFVEKEISVEIYKKGKFAFYDCDCAKQADAIGDSFSTHIERQKYVQNCLNNQYMFLPIEVKPNPKSKDAGRVEPRAVIIDITDYLRACSKYNG